MTRDEMRRQRQNLKRKTNSVSLGPLAKAAGIFALCVLMSCSAGQAPNFKTENEVTPAEDSIGERLFLDTRFAQYFATHMTGVNQPLAVGDPVVQQVSTLNGVLPGPFAGQSINCRSCHFVTEFQGVSWRGQSHLLRLHRAQPDSPADEWLHRHAAKLDAHGRLAATASRAGLPAL